jgi:hypothetical protein
MAQPRIFLATSGEGVNRLENIEGQWQVTQALPGVRVSCLVSDPGNSTRVYAGANLDGVLVSDDAGLTWRPAGMQGVPVKALAISPQQPQTIFAGCKPVSLYVSRNGGEVWEELPQLRRQRCWWWFSPADPPGWAPYVQALAISPTDPERILAGIEVGGVLRSQDGGRTWSKPARGAVLDCHSLMFHPTHGNWVYEGGGGGAAVSVDAGAAWRKPRAGLTKRYGWMVAADPAHPEVWYLSASSMPNILRGEFEPPAHVHGKAKAGIFRSTGGGAWELISGGLPEAQDFMPYALLTDPEQSGHLYAGLSNGAVWHSQDYGDNWQRLPFSIPGGIRGMSLIF